VGRVEGGGAHPSKTSIIDSFKPLVFLIYFKCRILVGPKMGVTIAKKVKLNYAKQL